jgi:hypothetical protein
MVKKVLILKCTSSFVAGGKIITPGGIVPGVPEQEAKGLIRRGKAVQVDSDERADSDLSELNVAELKTLAAEYDIDGADSMKKAQLVAAIEKSEAQ